MIFSCPFLVQVSPLRFWIRSYSSIVWCLLLCRRATPNILDRHALTDKSKGSFSSIRRPNLFSSVGHRWEYFRVTTLLFKTPSIGTAVVTRPFSVEAEDRATVVLVGGDAVPTSADKSVEWVTVIVLLAEHPPTSDSVSFNSSRAYPLSRMRTTSSVVGQLLQILWSIGSNHFRTSWTCWGHGWFW